MQSPDTLSTNSTMYHHKIELATAFLFIVFVVFVVGFSIFQLTSMQMEVNTCGLIMSSHK